VLGSESSKVGMKLMRASSGRTLVAKKKSITYCISIWFCDVETASRCCLKSPVTYGCVC
jgi:hypothetical protein